jgi:lipopolysaccharide transport system ATP-binding protein
MAPIVVFDNVSKKFRRGERHTSFRDLVPSLVRRVFRPEPRDVLGTEEFWALRNVSFDVAPGEALGIIGANGAGKSTTLKILTRILRPNGGACRVAGRIGALIEVAAGFHPDLTGRENVFLQGAIMGMKRREIQQRFDEIVDFAGVADYMDTPVKRYSSGMNARLGFSIAAHLRPDVLIVDEVLSVGDMAFQERCFQRMLQFRRDGIAIVLVSHNLQAVASLCQRSILLAGRVKASGPTIDVLADYVQSSHHLEKLDAAEPIEVLSVALATQDGAEGTHVNVAPGTRVRLRVAATTSRPLDDVCFGFVLHRSTDQFMVYDGNFQRRELTDADFLGEFRLDLEFCANLVRGHYYLSWHVYDNPTQTYLLPKRQVATLTVHESRSQGGVADVGLTAALQVHARASRPDNRRGNVAIR